MKNDAVGRFAAAISVACVLIVATTLGVLAMPAIRARLGFAPVVTPSYELGSRIDVPSSIYDSSPFTVVLFARNGCDVCQSLKPWLSKMAATVTRQSAARVVMVAGASRRDEEIGFAAEIGLGQERVYPLPPQKLKVRQVPALVLVNRQGKVLFSLDGPPQADRDGVIARIVSLAQSR